MTTSRDVRRYRENLQAEVDGAALYRALADCESEPAIAELYRGLAAAEEKHAGFWRTRLEATGETGAGTPSGRARILIWVARRFGPRLVLPTLAAQEYANRNAYLDHPETAGTSMTEDERTHARILQRLVATGKGVGGSALVQFEVRHRSTGGNALRAAVLGANDGLCSNLSLIMGVAGATTDHRTMLLAGFAGLLSGACSMALGEWVSVTSSREAADREMRIERSEIEEAPEEEREELQLIFEAKGLSPEESRALSARVIESPSSTLDLLTREELGINPEDLGGSPAIAALASFTTFSIGAIIPLIPYLFLVGPKSTAVSVGAGAVGLFVIGAAITLFTGRSVWLSGLRQLGLGLAAAGVTFGIGKAIGVAVAG
jgi:vacuolar iron transporter family protein